MEAARTGDFHTVDRLLKEIPSLARTADPQGKTALIHASAAGSVPCMVALLEAPTPPPFVAPRPLPTPALTAPSCYPTPHHPLALPRPSPFRAPPPLTVAVQAGTDVGAVDSNCWSGLMYAALNGFLPAVETLLRSGAPVSAADVGGRTAIMSAALNGHVAIVEALVRAGAAPGAGDSNSWASPHPQPCSTPEPLLAPCPVPRPSPASASTPRAVPTPCVTPWPCPAPCTTLHQPVILLYYLHAGYQGYYAEY